MRFALLAILFFVVSCETPWEVEFEQPLREVPTVYRQWHAEVARCAGRASEAVPGRFARIRWYSGGSIFHRKNGEEALGLWTEPHKIVIRSDFVSDRRVVKHELVHDLLGTGAHGSSFFATCVE